MSSPRTAAFAWGPAGLYMALIWVLSSLSLGPGFARGFPFGDKGVHLLEYGLLGFLLAHAAGRTWPRRHPLRTASLAWLIAVLWGLFDEIHQAFVPGRASDVLDLAADACGAALGVGARHLKAVAARLVPAALRGSGPR